jgi:hypothetical protein
VKLPEGTQMPIVYVDDAMHDDYSCIAMFFGDGAYTRATEFISTLDQYMSGRYGISICDIECSHCGETFWHEAFHGGAMTEWRTPCCYTTVSDAEIEAMTTLIPELES